jgi:predicted dehydrogenase
MARRDIGIIMNGVSGRMGKNQHLIRSILAIRQQGGVPLANGDVVWPDPILVGRTEDEVRPIAEAHGLTRWSTNLAACLANPRDTVYFDSVLTGLRPGFVRQAIAAGKHVYCEKPLALDAATALELAELAERRGVKNGIVQDKIFLPGIRKLRRLLDEDFFGRLLSVRCEFGYWVFEGDRGVACQRPSWNYRREAGGGLLLDMFCHWRYVIGHLFGAPREVLCLASIDLPERLDEAGQRYPVTAEDTAYAIFRLESGLTVQMNTSWAIRVYRDELLQMQVDGTEASALVGLRNCRVQRYADTPRPVWNPDEPDPIRYREFWQPVAEGENFENAFKVQWERFLRHVAGDEPFPHSFRDGARGVQLAEAAMRSWQEHRWVELPVIAG